MKTSFRLMVEKAREDIGLNSSASNAPSETMQPINSDDIIVRESYNSLVNFSKGKI